MIRWPLSGSRLVERVVVLGALSLSLGIGCQPAASTVGARPATTTDPAPIVVNEPTTNSRELQEQHQGEVVCLSLNCNFNGLGSPDDEREMILKVLQDTKPVFQHLISSDADEQLYAKVGIASIQLSKQFDNEQHEYGEQGFTYSQHIAPYVNELVKSTQK
jgi:hypothetical protein